jgi:hypothetical protein
MSIHENERAYLLAFIRDDQLIGYGVFSEPEPSHIGKGRYAIVAEARGETLQQAIKRVVVVAQGLGALLGPASLEALGQLEPLSGRRHVEIDAMSTVEQLREDSILLHQLAALLEGREHDLVDTPLPPGSAQRTGELGVLARLTAVLGGLKDMEGALARIRSARRQLEVEVETH